MNYIGSKYSLIPNITKLISQHIPVEGVAIDLFSGTTTVAQALKSMGFETYANDWQFYSFVTAHSHLHLNSYPEFKTLIEQTNIATQYAHSTSKDKGLRALHSLHNRGIEHAENNAFRVLWYLEQLKGHSGRFVDEYCENGSAGRLYFSEQNGKKIQAIGDQIRLWYTASLLSKAERYWLRAVLVESADRVANTASVYGAYLKKLKKTAQKPLQLVAIPPTQSPQNEQEHQAFCGDASSFFDEREIPNATLTYIDPPYNHRQYSGNYHILETIARWDLSSFTPKGITGQRENQSQRSPFCSKREAYPAFDHLFSTIRSRYILFSYNNEGLLSETQLRELFQKYCANTQFISLDYGRFRADTDRENRCYTANSVQEFLILGQMKE